MGRKMRRRLRKAGERMQPGYGGSIGQPEGTMRTADFRDSDGDGIDDRDQRRPGGININEKRRNRQARRQTPVGDINPPVSRPERPQPTSIHPQPPTYGGKPGDTVFKPPGGPGTPTPPPNYGSLPGKNIMRPQPPRDRGFYQGGRSIMK